jgi:alkyl sulfatase BDS1-like metallo-beta-lactamase superfamily hydrolase
MRTVTPRAVFLGALFAFCGRAGGAVPDPTPTPTTFTLLKEQMESRIVTEAAKGKELVIGVRITDTKEDFTIALRDQQIQVTEGLPTRADAVLSGRRRTLENLLKGSETLSSGIRRNLIEVQGSIDKVFALLDCCIRAKP